MSDLSIIIVEDNLVYALELEIILLDWGYEVLGIFDNGKDALTHIKKHQPDLVLMDIDIFGQLNGIEVGQKIAPLNIPIIYMTSLKEIELFEASLNTNSISYLIKPFDSLSLKGAIKMAYPKMEIPIPKSVNPDRTIFIKRGNEYHSVYVKSIDWIEIDRNYSTLHCGSKRYVQKISITNLLNHIGTDQMVRIHRSYVIQLGSIEKVSLSNNEITIRGKKLPIGRSYRENLLKKLEMLS